jgi:hypothetical protein
MHLRTVAISAVVVSVAIVVGFLAGMAVITVLGVIVPFREDVDDDTMREVVPVALAYLTWTVTTIAIATLALRRLLQPHRN